MELPPGLIRLAPGVTVAADRIAWSQSRSGGPGGQNVNKTESKAELRLALSDVIGLHPRALERLAALAGSRLVDGLTLLICCDETRSLRQNRDLALERLQELVVEAQAVPRPRRATRPSRASVQRRIEGKRRDARRRSDRRTSDE
jgi:ribosome-associated protein